MVFFVKKFLFLNVTLTQLISPGNLQNIPENSERLYLVGRNWNENPEKPYALGVGFNDWKLGFIADYLPYYRIAFATGKFIRSRGRSNVKKLDPQPSAIYSWGYKAPFWLQKYAENNNIPFIRVEDGFIRSAELGAMHTTPYSLVFDEKGMHYRSDTPSELTELLNTYNFQSNLHLIKKANELKKLIIDNRISKYNPPNLHKLSDSFSIKTRKKVLVLGQVERDAAMKFGNPSKWSMSDLVKLAKFENPDADVFYRPHPEVFRGFQKSILRARQINQYSKIIPPTVPFLESLEGVDHVYTVTSLSGLECLIRGIKVTTLGTPFYAGWGLTDDRAENPYRKRKLTLNELFCAVYLLYPKYLANLEDACIGFKVTCSKIIADRYLGQLKIHNDLDEASIINISQSSLWPRLLIGGDSEQNSIIIGHNAGKMNIQEVIQNFNGVRSKKIVSFMMAGWVQLDDTREIFLNAIRKDLDISSFNHLLLELHENKNGPYLASQVSWLLNKTDSKQSGSQYIKLKRIQEENNFTSTISHESNIKLFPQSELNKLEQAQSGEDEKYDDTTDVLFQLKIKYLEGLLDAQMEEKKYDEAEQSALKLFSMGHINGDILLVLIDICIAKFDFDSVLEISKLMQTISGKYFTKSLNHAASYVNPDNFQHYWKIICSYVTAFPDKTEAVLLVMKKFEDKLNITNIETELLCFLNMNNDQTVAKAFAWNSIGQHRKALYTIETIIKNTNNSPSISVAYSQILTAANFIEKAESIIDHCLKAFPNSLVYREAMRICVIKGDYVKGLKLLNRAKKSNVFLGDMTPRKIYFGARMPKEAFSSFKELNIAKNLRDHFPRDFSELQNFNNPKGKFLALPLFGPGDEIRFASIYNKITDLLPHKEFYIGCEPRFQKLFERSFPHFKIVPIKRLRIMSDYKVDDFDRIPSSLLRVVIDNNAVDYIKKSDDFCLVTDLLEDALPKYESFSGKSYLKADEAKTEVYKNKLPKGKPLIGISWRSSLTTYSRIEHYLTIQELSPILELDQFQFVNLQYDDCEEELAWAEKNFPGKIINFKDIDQYNDFDSVASLMKSLDLVISPATTVVELSGALGCPTWLLSNSSELHWRKLDGTKRDVWHNSIEHIEGDEVQNKESLISNLRIALMAIN